MSSPKKIQPVPSPENSYIDLDNPEFRMAWDVLEHTRNSVFLTGRAGTGKSTFLRYLTSVTKRKYIVLAPTGIAAVNVGGQTLHSFFRIPLIPLLPDDAEFSVQRIRQRLKYSSSHIKLIRTLDLIIIDEISMVRADVIDFIDKVLRIYSGNMRQPFGGKQMLFVGDIFQLEPVVTGNDRDVLAHAYSSFYFFNARVMQEMQPVSIELQKVYRQDEQRFISILDNVRMGVVDGNDLQQLNARYVSGAESAVNNIEHTKDFTMTIATRRDMVDNINERHLNALKTPSIIYHGRIEKDFPSNSLPTDLELELKVGAQVVFIKNDPERRWVNGTIAVVETCTKDSITVKLEDGEIHKVDVERWSNVKYIYNERKRTVEEVELGSFVQYPLKLAWALTIHKSQGLTFNNVIIDMGRGAFAGGQTYVALSRCRSLEGITLCNPITPRDIYIKPEISRFASQFNNRELIEKAIETSKADALYALSAREFDRNDFTSAVEHFSEALAARNVLSNPAARRLIAKRIGRITALEKRIDLLCSSLAANQRRFDELAAQYTSMGETCVSDGWDVEAALANYDKALELSPDYAPALLGKATILARRGDRDEAEKHYRHCADVNKAYAWQARLGLGDMMAAAGDDFAAINEYLAAFDIKRNSIEVIDRLIGAYKKAGMPEIAAEYIKIRRRIQDTDNTKKKRR